MAFNFVSTPIPFTILLSCVQKIIESKNKRFLLVFKEYFDAEKKVIKQFDHINNHKNINKEKTKENRWLSDFNSMTQRYQSK